MAIETMEILSYGLLAAGVVLALTALILFKVLNIPRVISELNGKAAAKTIDEMRKTHGRTKLVETKTVRALEEKVLPTAPSVAEVNASVQASAESAVAEREETGTQLLDMGTQLLDSGTALLPERADA